MTTTQELLKASVKELVVPLLRDHGFKGSYPTWTCSNAQEDTAVVNVQLSAFNTRDAASAYVNLAVAPQPWRAWTAARLDQPLAKAVKESDGLWRQRLGPTHTHGRWEVTDVNSAREAAEDIAERLRLEALPTLMPMLDREVMIETVRSGSLGEMPRSSFELYYEMALAVLLADEGPSPELLHVIESLKQRPTEVATWPDQRTRLLAWLQQRAGSASVSPA